MAEPAENQTDKSATSREQQPSKAEPKAAPKAEAVDKFAVSDLVARSVGFLGEPPHVVAAALHGETDDLSLEDARERVKQYLEQPQTPKEA